MKRIAGPLLVAAVAVTGAAPAHAQTVEHVDFSFEIDETFTDFCAFPVQLTGVSAGHVQALLDDAGNVIRVNLHYRNDFTFTANGKSLTEMGRYNEFDVDFEGGGAPHRVIYAGLFAHVKLPTGGARMQAGRIIDDVLSGTVIFEKGNPIATEEDEAFCAALS